MKCSLLIKISILIAKVFFFFKKKVPGGCNYNPFSSLGDKLLGITENIKSSSNLKRAGFFIIKLQNKSILYSNALNGIQHLL